ncbi:MAG: hypothetical protein N3F03_00405 [Ignavibacteria bacterium]|nr:hypothetical protein [Ignavibacteria bacterium]
MTAKKFNQNLFIILISIILTGLIYIKTDVMNYNHKHFSLPWDHHKYIWMASQNLDFHIAPFCWRIFVPFLASILPFDLLLNFKLIALISVALTGFFVYKIGQKIFNDHVYSISMMIGYFSISFAVKYVIYDFWLPDAFAILLITAGIYFVLIKNDLAFVFTMTIGALTKESVLFVIPLYYSLQAKKIFEFDLIKKTLIVSILPILIFVLIRIFIPAYNSDENYLQTIPYHLRLVQYESSEYNLQYLISEVALKKIKEFDLYLVYRNTIYTFLVHFLLLFVGVNLIKEWLIKFSPFILLSYLQIFFAANEERLVSIAFLPIILSSIKGLSKLFENLPFKNFSILFLNAIFFLMVLSSGIFYGGWLIIRQVFVIILLWAILKFISLITKHKSNQN